MRHLSLAFAFALAACGARTELATPIVDDGAATPRFVHIACGERHACALRSDGAVYCWGLNTSAQTSAPASETSAPVLVPLSGSASAIGLGAYHSCAIVSGLVYCWGDDLVGQLGSDVPLSAAPILITAVSKAIEVSGGFSHTCALLVSGAVACWGQNSEGELGNGKTSSSLLPIGALITEVTSLARSGGGTQHTCGIVQNGGVKCWGSNVEGEIGSGALDGIVSTPTLAVHDGALAVAVVDYSSCAVMIDGSLRCWGAGEQGQLGDGAHDSSNVPIVANVTDVRAVAVGTHHACALQAGGRVSCWGDNESGELGDGTTTSSTDAVEAMPSGATDLCTGDGQTCVTTTGGHVMCWGLGTTNPTAVVGL